MSGSSTVVRVVVTLVETIVVVGMDTFIGGGLGIGENSWTLLSDAPGCGSARGAKTTLNKSATENKKDRKPHALKRKTYRGGKEKECKKGINI